ncbi:hypothetical protein L9F63_009886, partial [Diploptera punctata]
VERLHNSLSCFCICANARPSRRFDFLHPSPIYICATFLLIDLLTAVLGNTTTSDDGNDVSRYCILILIHTR